MRIGIDLVSDTGRPSGIHSYTNGLLAGLADVISRDTSAADWSLVIFAWDDFEWLGPLPTESRVEIVSAGKGGLDAARRRLAQQTRVPELARRHGVDLVHSLNNVLPLRLPVPGVVTVHDLSAFVMPGRFGLLKRGFLRWAVPRSVRAAAAVVAISENTRGEILRRIPGADPAKIHTLPNGVDGRFDATRDAEAERRIARAHGLPDEFLLTVCAAEPGKNLLGVTRALEIVLEEHGVAIPWVLAGGSGKHLRELERRWSDSPIAGSVHSLGVVPSGELDHLYRMARAFAFPSLYEGFGLPLIESFASGTPAITSGGDSALNEVAGRSACIVDPTDPGDIARGVLRVWKHREVRELLRARGRRRAAEFTWERTAAGLLEIYRQVGASAVAERETSRGLAIVEV